MVFSGSPFLFYFLPAVLALYFLVPRRLKNPVLLVFSLFFYAWGEPVYVLLMIFSIVMDYALGRWLYVYKEKGNMKAAKRVLVLSVVLNLALLGFFKYTNFLLDTIGSLFRVDIPLLELSLPIGISFYTFQAMSYLIDLYRGDVGVQRSVFNFGTYVSLFPQLIAGPIVRLSTVEKELADRKETVDDFSSGIKRFVTGLGKKVLLANTIGAVWTEISAMEISTLPVLTAWIGVVAFTFQIYFDFSGYSDMAIGLGRMFGFHFMENFNYPYTARSITDFWRRWHISLSTWFREYVYIPLGGNRRGLPIQLRNLLIVWTLTGVWHGASWSFVTWGLYFGVLLILEKLFLLKLLERLPKFVGHIYTMFLVIISWAIFAFDSLGSGLQFIRAMFGGFGQAFADRGSWYLLYTNLILLVILIIGSTQLPRRLYGRMESRLLAADGRGRPHAVALGAVETVLVLAGLVLSVSFVVDASYNPFLYFRF